MNFSLKIKLLSATIASVATIAVLGLAAYSGASIFADKLKQSHVITVALHNHANSDMMDDALRSDVYAAFYAASKAPLRRDEISAETHRHASNFKKLFKANETLSLPPDISTTLEQLEPLVNSYISSAEDLVSVAFENEQKAKFLLINFEKQFSALEMAMKEAGDKIQAFDKVQTEAADVFSAQTKWLSLAGLIIGILIAGVSIWVTLRHVLSPLTELTGALKKLAQGDLEVKLPMSRKDEIGAMARTVEAFKKDAVERIKITREARILSKLNEWLQSAKSETELYQMIAEFLRRLLPDCAGSIYIYANSRDVLECVKVWNGNQGTVTMHPDDCWGLRHGRTYTHGEDEFDFDCSHVQAGAADDYCCIPILAHGETVGLLHLEYAPQNKSNNTCSKTAFVEQRRLGLACAEHISLAIANVKLRDELRDQSIRDVLTGLYNRRYMLETSRREFQRAARQGQCVSMLSIDIDHFKTFNDNHGHDAGDTVLRAVGEVLLSSFRGDDVPCRFGGEEFVVLLPAASTSVAQQRAEEVRAKIQDLAVRYAENNLPRITISVGIASYPQSGTSPMEVLKVADEALYLAKQEGRNCVRLSPACQDHSDADLTHENKELAICEDDPDCCEHEPKEKDKILDAAE